jgi:hypothetical protein
LFKGRLGKMILGFPNSMDFRRGRK